MRWVILAVAMARFRHQEALLAELDLRLQPIVSAADRRIVAAEQAWHAG